MVISPVWYPGQRQVTQDSKATLLREYGGTSESHKNGKEVRAVTEFSFVAEDIEWLHDELWSRRTEGLSSGHMRRASLSLASLLVDGLIAGAWHSLGFSAEPLVSGPDLSALATRDGLELRHAAAVVAGGGREDGHEMAFVGAFRANNPETGVPADAPAGFAVKQTTIIRKVGLIRGQSELQKVVEKLWPLSEYLESPAAVRRGHVITRRDLLAFFRTHLGGIASLSSTADGPTVVTTERAVQELFGKIDANRRDGIYFELLSMCQSVGRSEDLQKLARAIRAIERRQKQAAPVTRTFKGSTDGHGFNFITRMPAPAGSVDTDAELEGRLVQLEDLDTPIYRTIRWKHVAALIQQGSSAIVAPQMWDDPFERLICETDVYSADSTQEPRRLDTLRRVVYGQCWSLNPESDALWRIYSTVDKDRTSGRNAARQLEGLRLRTTPRRLLRAILDALEPELKECLFLGRIRYTYQRDALEVIASELARSYETRSVDEALLGTLTSVLIKREAFAYEEECRLVLIDLRKAAKQESTLGLSVVEPTEVFRHVTLDPRLSAEDVEDRKRELRSYGFTGEIVQSSLLAGLRIDLNRFE